MCSTTQAIRNDKEEMLKFQSLFHQLLFQEVPVGSKTMRIMRSF